MKNILRDKVFRILLATYLLLIFCWTFYKILEGAH